MANGRPAAPLVAWPKRLRAVAVEAEADDRFAGVFVEGRLRVDEVLAGDDDTILTTQGTGGFQREHDRRAGGGWPSSASWGDGL